MCFDSNSSTASASTTLNSQAQGGNNSTNTSTNINGNNNTVTDQGAVAASFGFAQHVSDNAVNQATASMVSMQKTSQDALGQVADAYANTKAGEYKILAYGVMAVVAVVAFKSFGKAA